MTAGYGPKEAYALMASGNCGIVTICFDEELISADYMPKLECPIQRSAKKCLETTPAIGQGTFGSDNYSAEQITNAVQMATDMGYRHFD